MHQTFIDLDELILLCRDKSSQKFIQEAVACYRAGAFRSCIVSTWNAVVFDFLHKLRELELFGDKKAPKLLQEFEKLRSDENFKDLWQFESNIPEKAHEEFELISPIERLDIERLFQDRSRCAHPSMTSLEEPFEATAELARYHLRSAITHLLQRPPVQGRAAKERIFQDIKSEYFPVDSEEAIKYFQASPLVRARFTLIQDIVIGLTTSLLIENLPELERERQFSALTAVSKMYVQETGKILNEKLSGIIINKVDDDNWDKVIIYLAKITVWESLSPPCQLKAQNFVEKLEVYENENFSDVKTLIKAAHIDFLRDYVIKKFDNIPVQDILSLNDTCGDNLFQTKIILPSLKKSALKANLNDLFLIISKTSLASDETIVSCINERVKSSPLNDLADVMSNYNYEFWQDFIKDILEEKIINADFIELLSAKSKYNSSGKSKPEIIEIFNSYINQRVFEIDLGNFPRPSRYLCEIDQEKLILSFQNFVPKIVNFNELVSAKFKYNFLKDSVPEIIEIFDNCIAEKIKEVSLNDVLTYSVYDRKVIPEKLLISILKTDISAIINKFANTGNYNEASDNTQLLIMVAEELNNEQWKDILRAFLQNPNIYKSYSDQSCLYQSYSSLSYSRLPVFQRLVEKSLELNNKSVQPYLLSFREKLGSSNQNFKQLKLLIDLYLTPEQKNQLNN
ncbi:hypothetical protein [Okeania sp. KiyG1]|uniref:hypothetical protein n=1 Tax=Okeania sp. KiyG1 TaxID=2720165 RepID=UPI001921B994|nr:hypothetical protein [Okeania sp. KiyG1]GGA01535.1 hypothetical protein CYANOKiyG1_13450 [Okeania sp. KiyG1]